MQFLLLRQAGCSHIRCSQSCPSNNLRSFQQSAGGVLSRSIRHVPSKAGRPHPAHGRCQAVPDQHAIDLLVSSNRSLPALMGEKSQVLHHSAAAVQVLGDIADIDAKTAKLLATVLQPFLSVFILLMIIRIVLSWYPQIPGSKMPWAVAYKPTEPILGPTRNIIKPVGGVDISPIIWVALLSFINEILLGPQGILNLLQRKIDLP